MYRTTFPKWSDWASQFKMITAQSTLLNQHKPVFLSKGRYLISTQQYICFTGRGYQEAKHSFWWCSWALDFSHWDKGFSSNCLKTILILIFITYWLFWFLVLQRGKKLQSICWCLTNYGPNCTWNAVQENAELHFGRENECGLDTCSVWM